MARISMKFSTSSFCKATLVVLAIVLMIQLKGSVAQQTSCAAQLGNLNVCAPFVMPGANRPSGQCCAALSSVTTECLCSTLRIASQLPSECNLTPRNCNN